MSARIGMAVAMAYILRRKRKADPPHAAYLTDLPAPPRPIEDAHRDTDALDLIDDETAQTIADERIENRLRETLRRTGYAAVESGNYPPGPVPEVTSEPETAAKPATRCRKCGYVKDSDSCRIMCGEGS